MPVPYEHLSYVADRIRTSRFRAALGQVIRPGDDVLDLGSGVGVLGLLCAEAGAGSVAALERGDVVEIARQALASALGPERSRAIRAESNHHVSPSRFDVLVCDHVGYFGFDYGVIAFVADARRRLLKPGGRIVPRGFDLYLAPVSAPSERDLVDASLHEDAPGGLRLLHRYAVNMKHSARLGEDCALAEPVRVAGIDLRGDSPDCLTLSARFTAAKAGQLDGLGGWFECFLSDSVTMTNSPLAADRIDRPQAFLPIETPVAVSPGDVIEAEVVARHAEHLISWTVRHLPSGRRFRHSTWTGTIITEAELARRSPAHVPTLTPEARARALVLGFCDGRRSRGEVEAAVLAGHPDLFPTRGAAEAFISGVLDRDTE